MSSQLSQFAKSTQNKFYFVVFNTVGNTTDFTVFKYLGNTVVKQVEIMQRLQATAKDFQSDTHLRYTRKIKKFLNDYMCTDYMEIKEAKSPIFEDSSICIVVPEKEKYIFVDLKNQLEYFGFNDNIKGYNITQWFDYHFKPYQLSDTDFKAVEKKLKTLEQYRDSLAEAGKDFGKLSQEELFYYLEMVGLY